MSPPGRAANTGTGISTARRKALTGRQLQQVMIAARAAMDDSDADVSPSKITNMIRRFERALTRTHLSFHQFLASEANRKRVYDLDPGMRVMGDYLDPTGIVAVNNVMHLWDADERRYRHRDNEQREAVTDE